MSGRQLAEIPLPSTELEGTRLEDDGDMVRIRYSYERDGRRYTSGLEFERVRAYRHRAEAHCTVWHIDAYDTLTEIEDSEWVTELLDATPADLRDRYEMHHYVLYLDSAGCYELVAAGWRFLPETPAGPP